MTSTTDVASASPAVVESRDRPRREFSVGDQNMAADVDEDDVMHGVAASESTVKISQKQKLPQEPLPAFATREATQRHGISSPDANQRETGATLPSASENDHPGGTPHVVMGQRSEVHTGESNKVATRRCPSASHGTGSWTTLALCGIEAVGLPKSTSALRGGTLVSGMLSFKHPTRSWSKILALNI